MSGVPKVRGVDIDRTYEAVDSNISGGMFVSPSTTATVSGEQGAKPAASGDTSVLGVAAADAVTEANRAGLEQTTDAFGNSTTNVAVQGATFTVYESGETLAQFQAGTAVAYNARIKIGTAAGTVTLLGGGDDLRLCVGRCRATGGMGTGGGAGLVKVDC